MKKLSLLFLFIVTLSFAGFSQFEEEDGQMFGGSRNLKLPKANCISLGEVTTDFVEHEFVIKNTELGEMTISNISLPKGFGVIVTDDVIESESEATIIVTVYKKYFEIGKFSGDIVVETTEEKPTGVVVKRETTYNLKGEIK